MFILWVASRISAFGSGEPSSAHAIRYYILEGNKTTTFMLPALALGGYYNLTLVQFDALWPADQQRRLVTVPMQCTFIDPSLFLSSSACLHHGAPAKPRDLF